MRTTPSLRWLLFVVGVLAISTTSFAQVGISIRIDPPALPVYEQPLCPAEGYIWTPGYWAYDDGDDYYWVPGTWVLAPETGFFWTPGYWAWVDKSFVFYEGYWGPHVGFYGGIVYGFGYFGAGYEGGRWENGPFSYNPSVNNLNITNIRNVYNTTVINNTTTVNRVSYNGGPGGTKARPTAAEEAAVHERHIPPVPVQTQHAQAARANPQQRASANHGKPAVAATPKPGALRDRAAVPAKAAGAPYNPPANRTASRPRANPSPRAERAAFLAPALPSTPTTFHLENVLLRRTRETRSWTRNTSNSRKSYTRSRTRNDRDSSRGRSRTTSGWRNGRLISEKGTAGAAARTTDAAIGTKTRPATAAVAGKTAARESQTAEIGRPHLPGREYDNHYVGSWS
jgi:hypothetical protein